MLSQSLLGLSNTMSRCDLWSISSPIMYTEIIKHGTMLKTGPPIHTMFVELIPRTGCKILDLVLMVRSRAILKEQRYSDLNE